MDQLLSAPIEIARSRIATCVPENAGGIEARRVQSPRMISSLGMCCSAGAGTDIDIAESTGVREHVAAEHSDAGEVEAPVRPTLVMTACLPEIH